MSLRSKVWWSVKAALLAVLGLVFLLWMPWTHRMAESLVAPGIELGFWLFGVGEVATTLVGLFVGEVLFFSGVFLLLRLVWEWFAWVRGKGC